MGAAAGKPTAHGGPASPRILTEDQGWIDGRLSEATAAEKRPLGPARSSPASVRSMRIVASNERAGSISQREWLKSTTSKSVPVTSQSAPNSRQTSSDTQGQGGLNAALLQVVDMWMDGQRPSAVRGSGKTDRAHAVAMEHMSENMALLTQAQSRVDPVTCLFRTDNDEWLLAVIAHDRVPLFADWGGKVWRELTLDMLAHGRLVTAASPLQREPHILFESRWDVLEHPSSGQLSVGLFMVPRLERRYYHPGQGAWLPIPLEWELALEKVQRLIAAVQARMPQWNEPRTILKVLRTHGYDVAESVAWAKAANIQARNSKRRNQLETHPETPRASIAARSSTQSHRPPLQHDVNPLSSLSSGHSQEGTQKSIGRESMGVMLAPPTSEQLSPPDSRRGSFDTLAHTDALSVSPAQVVALQAALKRVTAAFAVLNTKHRETVANTTLRQACTEMAFEKTRSQLVDENRQLRERVAVLQAALDQERQSAAASRAALARATEELSFLRRDDVAGALQQKDEAIAALHSHGVAAQAIFDEARGSIESAAHIVESARTIAEGIRQTRQQYHSLRIMAASGIASVAACMHQFCTATTQLIHAATACSVNSTALASALAAPDRVVPGLTRRDELHVCCRVRSAGFLALRPAAAEVHLEGNADEPTQFAFDTLFGPDASDTQVMSSLSHMVAAPLRGQNACLFAHGTDPLRGLGRPGAPGLVNAFYKQLSGILQGSAREWTLFVSAVEMSSEVAYDLLAPAGITRLRFADSARDSGPLFVERTELQLPSAAALDMVLSLIRTRRPEPLAAAHHLLFFRCVARSLPGQPVCTGTVVFCELGHGFAVDDLAASGQSNLSADAGGAYSLFVLEQVLLSLRQGSGVVPVRQSRLTLALRDVLGFGPVCVLSSFEGTEKNTMVTRRLLALAARLRRAPEHLTTMLCGDPPK
eukprot:m.101206 g.101206  ORF g.101206 m.101206 type:complete len:936 (+) comp14086_c2_seq1:56-2863(+)